MLLLLSSFIAGMLTSLAPCMITLLPVIVGNSVIPGTDKKFDRKKPYIITASLVVSVILFTVLLKATTALIGVDPQFWLYVSGGIVILLGISLLFPSLWVRVSAGTGLEHTSNKFLARANKNSGLIGQIMTGAALGPVFASCSPVYALVLATVLPVNLALGLVYIIAFALGLGLALLAISLGGRRLISKLGWVISPTGWFNRALAILLIAVGLMIITGYDKKFQTFVIEKLPFDVTDIEQRLLLKEDSNRSSPKKEGDSTVLNIDQPYQAPELRSIQNWINSDGETLQKLKGKVVLIDFWTYSCINCQRTQPYLNDWHNKYSDKGLVILGVHAPEFAFEKVTKNVQDAVDDAKIKYPVGLDNDFATWQAYDNRFWPAKYLIDKEGAVRYTHFGEGEYAETEEAIQILLKEAGKTVSEKITKNGQNSLVSRKQTHETYLSYSRGERFANINEFEADKSVNYLLKNNLKNHEWSLGGTWTIGKESSTSNADGSTLRFRYSAKEVYLVMDGEAGLKVRVSIDDKPGVLSGKDVGSDGTITIDSARLYKIINADSFLDGSTLTLTFPSGVTVNAFTFGS